MLKLTVSSQRSGTVKLFLRGDKHIQSSDDISIRANLYIL